MHHWTSRLLALLLVCLTGSARPWAHHSFAAVYDQSKPLRVQGTVEAVEWKNPHVTMTLVSRDSEGAGTRWTFEMGAPRILTGRFGWTQQTVQVGDTVTIDGFRARNGGPEGAAVSITTRTGAQLRAVLPFR
jgi:hypothetical protein